MYGVSGYKRKKKKKKHYVLRPDVTMRGDRVVPYHERVDHERTGHTRARTMPKGKRTIRFRPGP